MKEFNNKILNLRQRAKDLHTIVGQFNLYIRLGCKNNSDTERLKIEIKKIKQSVDRIENEIDKL